MPLNIFCAFRKHKKWTQKDFADVLGVSQATVSLWESDLRFPDDNMFPKLREIMGEKFNMENVVEHIKHREKLSAQKSTTNEGSQ